MIGATVGIGFAEVRKGSVGKDSLEWGVLAGVGSGVGTAVGIGVGTIVGTGVGVAVGSVIGTSVCVGTGVCGFGVGGITYM